MVFLPPFDFLIVFTYTTREMIPFQERKKIRKIIYSKVSLVVLLVAVFFVARGAWGVHQKAQIALSERDIARASLTELESRNAELEASLVRLKSQHGLEAEVRQKYTVAKQGEDIVVIVDGDPKNDAVSGNSEDLSLWSKISMFFGF